MYELLYFSNGVGAPFTYSSNYATDGTIYTRGGEPVRLLCQVRDILRELHVHKESWEHALVGISSRTDQPDWAHELLQKFTITFRKEDEGKPDADSFSVRDVIQGPIEIAKDSKVDHFKRIAAQTGVAMQDILFFDNERCNCRDVAELGVVVVYSPDGVTNTLWEHALQEFPTASGQILGLDMAPDYPTDYRRTVWE
jgi:magnesium-dependent phosphatase 1